MPISAALSAINGELVLAKNNSGQIYWPAYNVDQIGSMLSGQSYNVYLTNPERLIYPANVP